MDLSTKVKTILFLHQRIGMFYLIVQEGTLIDWWIVSRETAFFLLYLGIMSGLLQGN
jgi:hypothetical protein